ncbi:hypothetical protein, partial [Escherichia coli]
MYQHIQSQTFLLNKRLPSDWLLSAGLINGRNVWRADLTEKYAQIKD